MKYLLYDDEVTFTLDKHVMKYLLYDDEVTLTLGKYPINYLLHNDEVTFTLGRYVIKYLLFEEDLKSKWPVNFANLYTHHQKNDGCILDLLFRI